MKIRTFVAASVLAAASAVASASPVVYDGVLVPLVPATGSVNGFSWFLGNGSQVDYWRFDGTAGQTLTLTVNRLNGNLDPALSFYSGTTTADTSLFSASSSWGGLTFLGSLDDEHPPFLTPGPDGDPFGSFVLPSTGAYTVVVGGGNSTDAGAYPYRITASVAAVPEPSTWAMLVAGLGALGLFARRRRPHR